MKKTTARQRVLAISGLVSALVAASCSVSASCGLKPSLETNFKKHDIVFTGTAQRKVVAPEEYSRLKWYSTDQTAQALKVRFKVESAWKGKLNKRVHVYTTDPREDPAPGYHFDIDGRYVVFANYWHLERNGKRTKEYLRTGECTWNIDLEFVEDETALVQELARLKSELKDADQEEKAGDDTKIRTETSKAYELAEPSDGESL